MLYVSTAHGKIWAKLHHLSVGLFPYMQMGVNSNPTS